MGLGRPSSLLYKQLMDLTVTDLLLYSFPGVLENNDIFRNALTGKLRKFGLNKSSFPGIRRKQTSLRARKRGFASCDWC